MTLDELELKVDAFETLLQHPGWILLTQHIGTQAEAALTNMRNAKTNDELVRETVRYMMLKDMPQAASMLKGHYVQMLNQKLTKK